MHVIEEQMCTSQEKACLSIFNRKLIDIQLKGIFVVRFGVQHDVASANDWLTELELELESYFAFVFIVFFEKLPKTQ